KGEAYIVWEDFTTPGQGKLMFDRSFDGGVTWGTDQTLLSTNVNLFFDPFNGGGLYDIPAQPNYGIAVAPWIDVDRSSGPNRGRVYIAYTDAPNGIGNATDHNNTDTF